MIFLKSKTLLFICLLFCVSSCGEKGPIVLNIGVNEPLCGKTLCECVEGTPSRAYETMIQQIKESTGIELKFSYYEEMMLLEEEIRTGRLDGMLCKTWSGLTMVPKDKRDFVRVADISKPEGEKGMRGVYIVLEESPIKTLKDMEGKRFALGQKYGYEKHHLAKQTLDSQGVKPSEFKEFMTCKESALALLEDRADAAVISDYAFVYGCICVVGEQEMFRTIGQTKDAIPFTSLFLDKKVDSGTVKKLKEALLSIKGDKVPKDMLSRGWDEPMPWAPKELKDE